MFDQIEQTPSEAFLNKPSLYERLDLIRHEVSLKNDVNYSTVVGSERVHKIFVIIFYM